MVAVMRPTALPFRRQHNRASLPADLTHVGECGLDGRARCLLVGLLDDARGQHHPGDLFAVAGENDAADGAVTVKAQSNLARMVEAGGGLAASPAAR